MRPFRSARLLLVPMLAVPLVLGTVVLTSGTAYAKVHAKPIKCKTLSGNSTSWKLEGCSQPAITGSAATGISPPFSPGAHTLTISWRPGAHRGGPTDTTTVSATIMTTKKNKCGTTATEYEVLGVVTANNFTPGVKLNSKVRGFVCQQNTGTMKLTNVVKNRLKPVRL